VSGMYLRQGYMCVCIRRCTSMYVDVRRCTLVFKSLRAAHARDAYARWYTGRLARSGREGWGETGLTPRPLGPEAGRDPLKPSTHGYAAPALSPHRRVQDVGARNEVG